MSRSKVYPEAVELMVAACCKEGEPVKKVREMANYLTKRMEECEKDVGKDGGVVNIYITEGDHNKDSNSYTESFVMSCLLYLLFRFKFLKAKIITSAFSPPKAKKNDFQIKMAVTQRLDNRFSKCFYERVEELLRDSHMQVKETSLHFQQISFLCQSQNIDQQSMERQLSVIRKREDCYKFIYKFYDHLHDILASRRVFANKNTLEFVTNNEDCICIPEIDHEFVGSEVCLKKIIGLQRKMHSCILVIKMPLQSYLQAYIAEEQEEEGIPLDDQEYEEADGELGYYAPFSGSPFEYLSRLYLSLSYYPEFKQINALLPKTPNITHLKIVKEFQQFTVPDINELTSALIKHNNLIEFFWLTNIQVTNLSADILEQLYVQCPYLTEFETNTRFRYLIEQTYTSTSPEQKQLKENERESQTILNALRLRKISLYHNLEMSKLLINKGYNFNAIIEIIDCIQPFCF